MQQVSAAYRGYIIFARGSDPADGPLVAAYSAYEVGPDNTYPGSVEGTLSKKFLSMTEAHKAAIAECKRKLDILLAQTALTRHRPAPGLQRPGGQRRPAWARG